MLAEAPAGRPDRPAVAEPPPAPRTVRPPEQAAELEPARLKAAEKAPSGTESAGAGPEPAARPGPARAAPSRPRSEGEPTGPKNEDRAPASAGAADARPAKPTSAGSQSLTRALGLRIGKVVLDPGHGGHDHGTTGPSGLAEKELVLDVTLRLGRLIQEGLGGEVVYTRQTDEFIPLEERTAIANEHKADLFLSIHANSSPVRNISGAEVFYLNFTTSRDALDVAARENAGHGKSIFELRELIQKIALKDKVDESREFARHVQASLSAAWLKLNRTARNRGVKKAPFVVLIGASMPSVLAEIGFLSNPRDEASMKKPECRQRIAEALYKAVERYAASLGQTRAVRASAAPDSVQSSR